MADVKAVKSGIWGDTTVWSTGALPASGDNVYSNTFTVTVTVNRTAALVTNAAGGTVAATSGGGFVLSDGVTLTANVQAGATASTDCVSYAGTAAATVTGN